MFVGAGASSIRDLEEAKKNAPCIIFIDVRSMQLQDEEEQVCMANERAAS